MSTPRYEQNHEEADVEQGFAVAISPPPSHTNTAVAASESAAIVTASQTDDGNGPEPPVAPDTTPLRSPSVEGGDDDWTSFDNDVSSPFAAAMQQNVANDAFPGGATSAGPEEINDNVGPRPDAEMLESVLDFPTKSSADDDEDEARRGHARNPIGLEEIQDHSGPINHTEVANSIKDDNDSKRIGDQSPAGDIRDDARAAIFGLEQVGDDGIGPLPPAAMLEPTKDENENKRGDRLEEIHDQDGPLPSTMADVFGDSSIAKKLQSETVNDSTNNSGRRVPVNPTSLQEMKDEDSILIPTQEIVIEPNTNITVPQFEHEDEESPQTNTTSLAASSSAGGSFDMAAVCEQEQVEPLPIIPEAYLVEDQGVPMVVSVHAELLRPWWKRKRVVCSLICFVVAVSAIAAGVSISMIRGRDGEASEATSFPSSAPTSSSFPSVKATASPSMSAAPSSSPTTCAYKLMANAQIVETSLSNPFNMKVSVDGQSMAVAAQELATGEVHVIFYSLVNDDEYDDEWVEKARFPEKESRDVYSISLSGKTALVGLDTGLNRVSVYEQNPNGDWDRMDELPSYARGADIDGDLACVFGQIFQKSGGRWELVDDVSPSHEFGSLTEYSCSVKGNTIVLQIGWHFHLYQYDQVSNKLAPLQSLPSGEFSSASLSQDYLVFSKGTYDMWNKCYSLDGIAIYQQKGSKPYTLLQHFNSSDDGECFRPIVAMDKDIIVAGGYNETIIFSQQNGYWEEALTLDQSFSSYEMSGRKLVTTKAGQVYFFNIENCVSVPTQMPSFSMHPTATAAPSASLVPSASPTETCYLVKINIDFDVNTLETRWEIRKIEANGTSVAFKAEPSQFHQETQCLKEGRYSFMIYDHWASYSVISNGELIAPGLDTGGQGAPHWNEEGTDFSIPYIGPGKLPTPFPTLSKEPSSMFSPINLESSGPATSATCYELEIGISFDGYPQETSWQVKKGSMNTNEDSIIVASSTAYNSTFSHNSLKKRLCLQEGFYEFTMSDAGVDGVCCLYGNGGYNLTFYGDNKTLEIAKSGVFKYNETTEFSIPYNP